MCWHQGKVRLKLAPGIVLGSCTPLRLWVGVSWCKSDSVQDSLSFESAVLTNVKILMLLWTHERTPLENSKHFKLLELFLAFALEWKFLPYGNKILPGKDRLMRISVCLLTVLRISMASVDVSSCWQVLSANKQWTSTRSDAL